MATERSTYSRAPHRGSSCDVFRPDRHQLLFAPLDHDRYRKRVEPALVELNRAAGHRFCPSAFETPAMQSFSHCFRLYRFRSLYCLHEHVESNCMPDRFLHHEVAEALAERVSQRRGEIVICWRDREHILRKLA